MKKSILFLILFSVLALLTSCADQHFVEACVSGHQYGFWGGIWHGFVSPLAFFGSLLSDDIAVWAPNNNGGWYAFGFLLGCGAMGKFLDGIF